MVTARNTVLAPRKGASENRRAQLREAQQRSRQRKLDALNDAKKTAETLQSKLQSTSAIIEELLQTADDATKARLSSLQALLGLKNLPPSKSGDALEGVQNAASDSASDDNSMNTSNDANFVFQLSDLGIESYDGFGGLSDSSGRSSGESPVSLSNGWQDNSKFVDEVFPGFFGGEVSEVPASTRSVSSGNTFSEYLRYSTTYSNDANLLGLVQFPDIQRRTLTVPSLVQFEVTFSRRLYRKAWETVYSLLSTPQNPAIIERAFGNTLGYVAPSRILSIAKAMLETNEFESLEFFTRPEFQLPRPAQQRQEEIAPVHSLVPLRLFDPGAEDRNVASRARVENPLMTPMDIEKYCIESGILASTVTNDGHVSVYPIPFQLGDAHWILDVDRFILALVTVGVCVGRHPSFPSRDVTHMLFQSMNRLTAENDTSNVHSIF